jgi:hypothetical protein
VRRLRKAGLPFSSLMPDSDVHECDVILTTRFEMGQFGPKAVALEVLDDNPGVFKGQVLSSLGAGGDAIIIGIDPGKRTGLAAFYGQRSLVMSTFASAASACSLIGAFARCIPKSRLLVRIGNGNGAMAISLVKQVQKEAPGAMIELVDESGTSAGSSKLRGVQRDQAAAAKIAFRKGNAVSPAPTRSYG